ncbi:MAG: phosphoglucosamine mutase [Spirochaetota bacterium]
MASTLMKSVSGIRGIVGESLTPELITEIGNAFAAYVKRGKVVIGRDSRCTGEAISLNMASNLVMNGCTVIDIGVVPTPTVQVMVEELGADAGIVVSASHNPIEWNAFKLINNSGSFFNQREVNTFFKMMEKDHSSAKWNNIGTLVRNTDANDVHIKKVLDVIDVKAIRKKKFKVVLDSVNGAGSIVTVKLLEKLGCRVIPLHCELTGTFPRGAEPVVENLEDLSMAVKDNNADIGFAQDPDADRLAIVDENGRPAGEEYTLTVVTDHILGKKEGSVVVNLSTTRAVEDVAVKHGASFSRSKVGEINVVEEMRKVGALIGGEGNGGVISPEVHLGRDSLAGIGYVLDMMAARKKSISSILEDMPRYVMKKGKVKVSGQYGDDFHMRLKKSFKGNKISTKDGIRIDFTSDGPFHGGWVHLRSSNTEPVFRIIAEGHDDSQVNAIYRHFERIVRNNKN